MKSTRNLVLAALQLVFATVFTTVFGAESHVTLELPPTPNNPRNSEGDLIRLANGNILFIYSCYEGTSHSDHAPANLVARESADGGLTWGDPRMVLRCPGGLNYMSVSLLRLQDGRLALFFLWKFSLDDCRPNVCFSQDEGQTWTEPVACISEVGYYVVNNSRVVQLADGSVLVPVALHNLPGERFDPNARIFCYISTDGCRTFKPGGLVENPGVVLQEPGVVQLTDGRVLMYIRSNGGCQILAWSRDGGMTWSRGEKSPFTSPLSPATVRNVPGSENLLVVWNDSPTERNPLTCAVVTPELKVLNKWVLDRSEQGEVPPRWFCYPAVLPLDAETFLVGYCAGPKAKWGLDTTRVRKVRFP